MIYRTYDTNIYGTCYALNAECYMFDVMCMSYVICYMSYGLW